MNYTKIDASKKDSFDHTNRFIEPGTILCNNTVVQKLSYLETINIKKGLIYFILRPVTIFKVPYERGFYLKYKFFPNKQKRSVAFRAVKRVFFTDGEKIKSAKGVDLIKTFLVLDIREKFKNLNVKIDFINIPSNNKDRFYKLKLSLYEQKIITDFSLKENSSKEKILLKQTARPNQYIEANTNDSKTPNVN